jgi:hypothetical protein
MTLSSANYQGDFTVGTASSPNFNMTFTSSSTFIPSGRRLLAQDWAALQGRQLVSLSANGHLASGAYIVRLTDNQTVLAKQIIIIK